MPPQMPGTFMARDAARLRAAARAIFAQAVADLMAEDMPRVVAETYAEKTARAFLQGADAMATEAVGAAARLRAGTADALNCTFDSGAGPARGPDGTPTRTPDRGSAAVADSQSASRFAPSPAEYAVQALRAGDGEFLRGPHSFAPAPRRRIMARVGGIFSGRARA